MNPGSLNPKPLGAIPTPDLGPLARQALYELCVQSPKHVVAALRGIFSHATGTEATTLHEDFAGSCAVARQWVSEGASNGCRALAIDLDDSALAFAAARAREGGLATRTQSPNAEPTLLAGELALARADVLNLPRGIAGSAADVVFVGNFSIGYLHTRAALLDYLRAAKARLDRAQSGFGGGVFVCDTYGGTSAFKLGGFTREHHATATIDGASTHYTTLYSWLHEAADPRTAMVTNSISFRVLSNGEQLAAWPRAFVYRWRLWSIAELRDAMLEAGFKNTDIFVEIRLAPGQRLAPVASPEELGDDWIVLVAAW